MNKALTVLIDSINAQLAVLNANDFKIYDEENSEYYLSEVYYNSEDDELKCRFKEELKYE
ncbi:hypothetical protein IRP63_05250 [Clostridium botulinum]|uniref:Uncharacterized protein n=1 Tax=Clostridium botulinum C/D str. DC5 TaxID=1443128 RepID=A0A0A0IJA7_CLOBO|nr:hypothetical protein [Clostridium botulinum]KGN00337.1 hypothetical protein Z955_03925 [Clostridium botulinum C/D str. DC5]KOC51343.1 hypothetical protein ADU89_13850 [Clostridium botulinum]KOC53707.1 hypothetical protein ADU90_13230 [Clostridium botulinum]MCD3234583.1 hypothetical protein [Clostridium botulinum D/C]MCD3239726.1 hypothetical protein [Clostridium botulinum D/C]